MFILVKSIKWIGTTLLNRTVITDNKVYSKIINSRKKAQQRFQHFTFTEFFFSSERKQISARELELKNLIRTTILFLYFSRAWIGVKFTFNDQLERLILPIYSGWIRNGIIPPPASKAVKTLGIVSVYLAETLAAGYSFTFWTHDRHREFGSTHSQKRQVG